MIKKIKLHSEENIPVKELVKYFREKLKVMSHIQIIIFQGISELFFVFFFYDNYFKQNLILAFYYLKLCNFEYLVSVPAEEGDSMNIIGINSSLLENKADSFIRVNKR